MTQIITTLSNPSLEKLARSLAKDKYQPPKRRRNSSDPIPPDEVDLDITGMAVLLQDLQPAILEQDSVIVAGGFSGGRPTQAAAKLVDLQFVPFLNPANPAYWEFRVQNDINLIIYNTTKIPFAAGSFIHWKTDYRSGLKLLDVHACFGTNLPPIVRDPEEPSPGG